MLNELQNIKMTQLEDAKVSMRQYE